MADPLTLTFTALADPTRRAILATLAKRGEATVKELSQPFSISPPAITKHLKVLEAARLISRGRAAQFRPCRIEPAALREVAGWIETYRAIWEERFDRLDAYLKTLATPPPRGGQHKRGTQHERKTARKTK